MTQTQTAPLGLSAHQQKILRDTLRDFGQSPDTFALHFGCDLQQLPASRFEEAVAWCHRTPLMSSAPAGVFSTHLLVLLRGVRRVYPTGAGTVPAPVGGSPPCAALLPLAALAGAIHGRRLFFGARENPRAFQSAGGWCYGEVLDFLQQEISGAQARQVIHFIEELHLKWRLNEDLIEKVLQAREEVPS